MRHTLLRTGFAVALLIGSGMAMACEYKAGETHFIDYAKCRYGDDAVLVVDLPKDSSWDNCVYYIEAFRPEKLLAVTRMRDGKEQHSINDRGQIGNPCYMTMQACEAALKTYKASQD